MKELKVLFIGIGSIAKRHIRNLHSIAISRNLNIRIDAFRHTPDDSRIEGIAEQYTDVNTMPDDYDIIFITNPTEMHLRTIKEFAYKGKNFFIEKPAVSTLQINDAKNMVLRDNAIYYVACPLRYNAVIQYIKNNIDINDVISVRSISSSYLPEWRLGQDYRDTYSAHRDMGGGVSIDLIHEWDYITYLFGWPQKEHCLIGKKSKLEIDSDDYAIYIAEYKDKIVEIHLDYFGRKTIREVQLMTDSDTIIGDIANNRIKYLRSGKTIEFNEERDDFQKRELNYFLDLIEGSVSAENGFLHGVKLLDLCQGKV